MLLSRLVPRLSARAVALSAAATAGASVTIASMAAAPAPPTVLPGDLLVKEHILKVPLNHDVPDGPQLELFVRELIPASKADGDSLPCLLYLQGGPGFPAGRPTCPQGGWQKAALADYRVLLLDQRGTGRSSPVTTQSLLLVGSPKEQAAYLSHFRADSIVKDCEIVRRELAGGEKLTLLGQSFGGFCILSYLSYAPEAIERALFTCGLAPVGQPADAVYKATYQRMEERNRRFYERYPQDVELVRSITRALHDAPATLPRGGTLTARRFLQLGLLLGSGSGFESLHDLLELARAPLPPAAPAGALPEHFLLAVEAAQQDFETNPIYWLLHEAIYCDGPASSSAPEGGASRWSAERVQEEMGAAWDYTTRLAKGAAPILLTGEMVFSWMGDDYAWLRPLKPCAELLAAKHDWPKLYHREALGSSRCPPVACLVSYEDVYVERAFSEATAAMLGETGRGAKLWVTNEFQHSGLRDQPETVFKRLLAMSKGVVAVPS
jgi:pimeloyl-ACP methyl ester carboxylesterase